MGKSNLIRILYIIFFIIGVIFLYLGHKNRKYNQIILGLAIILLSLFIMHFPIDWVKNPSII